MDNDYHVTSRITGASGSSLISFHRFDNSIICFSIISIILQVAQVKACVNITKNRTESHVNEINT